MAGFFKNKLFDVSKWLQIQILVCLFKTFYHATCCMNFEWCLVLICHEQADRCPSTLLHGVQVNQFEEFPSKFKIGELGLQ